MYISFECIYNLYINSRCCAFVDLVQYSRMRFFLFRTKFIFQCCVLYVAPSLFTVVVVAVDTVIVVVVIVVIVKQSTDTKPSPMNSQSEIALNVHRPNIKWQTQYDDNRSICQTKTCIYTLQCTNFIEIPSLSVSCIVARSLARSVFM